MAVNYSITQLRNNQHISFTDLDVKSIPPKSYNDDIQDFQQLVFSMPGNNTYFEEGVSYLIRLLIPPDKNYNLNYGIRLMNINLGNAQDLRETLNYQFVKYITIPRVNNSGVDVNTVWLYNIEGETGKFDGAEDQMVVNAAVVVEIINENEFNVNAIADKFDAKQRANKIFYIDGKNLTPNDSNESSSEEQNISKIWLCDDNGYFLTEDGSSEPKNFSTIISKNDILLAQTFASSGNNESQIDPVVREFIITPEENCNAIFLCLKLIPEDTDIQWINGEYVMLGRHVNLEEVQGSYAKLNNILSENGNILYPNVKNIAVWGRPEQLMAINGEEIKIGPSGYYELKLNNESFNIDSLCIANTEDTDKYIVDMQYIQNS